MAAVGSSPRISVKEGTLPNTTMLPTIGAQRGLFMKGKAGTDYG
jgi:hypothetical protein